MCAPGRMALGGMAQLCSPKELLLGDFHDFPPYISTQKSDEEVDLVLTSNFRG